MSIKNKPNSKDVFISQQKMLQLLADAIKKNPALVSTSYRKAGEQSKQSKAKQASK
ncbi:hypothetical protein J7X56_004594 [Vibrio parahaemolyticus]|nr:hypothetical protein [Vibrio parahaemolyticus]